MPQRGIVLPPLIFFWQWDQLHLCPSRPPTLDQSSFILAQAPVFSFPISPRPRFPISSFRNALQIVPRGGGGGQQYSKSEHSPDVEGEVSDELIIKLVKERTKFKIIREYSKAVPFARDFI